MTQNNFKPLRELSQLSNGIYSLFMTKKRLLHCLMESLNIPKKHLPI
jgi:hypothetical protein